MLQLNSHYPPFRLGSRGPSNEISLAPDLQMPATLDESRYMPSRTPLVPMEVDRLPHHDGRDSPPRDQGCGGPVGHGSLLLQHLFAFPRWS